MNDTNNVTVMSTGMDLTFRILELLRKRGTLIAMPKSDIEAEAAKTFNENVVRLVK